MKKITVTGLRTPMYTPACNDFQAYTVKDMTGYTMQAILSLVQVRLANTPETTVVDFDDVDVTRLGPMFHLDMDKQLVDHVPALQCKYVRELKGNWFIFRANMGNVRDTVQFQIGENGPVVLLKPFPQFSPGESFTYKGVTYMAQDYISWLLLEGDQFDGVEDALTAYVEWGRLIVCTTPVMVETTLLSNVDIIEHDNRVYGEVKEKEVSVEPYDVPRASGHLIVMK